ncbi:MAG: PD-(D/E)XK nuclease family protein [Alistipes sp.]|nr:PD-(D/E)XK nuclease family protein [Alistipes sp.]
MSGFLKQVAEQLYGKYSDKVSELVILLPSQRARLFFCEALSEIVEHPIWSPHFVTVDELMSNISTLHSADRLRLISELYNVYPVEQREDFDRFYSWGEMLVADFDMVDKYRVDADKLFINIADIKEIEADVDYLTPEQQQIIRRFKSALGDTMTLSEQKQFFLKFWRALPKIYADYKARLRELGIGYSGMIYRDAAEIITSSQSSPLQEKKYVVVGFNALSSCEKVLFDHLKNCFNADFFWDYNDYFTQNKVQEAGRFIRENIERYPPQYNISHRDLTKSIKSITVTSTATSAAQCKYVAQLLQQIAPKDKDGNILPLDRDTAIVLTDENMLEPLLYALPAELKGMKKGSEGVNVTMGYPLRSTLAYSFVERLLELQNHAAEKSGEATFYHQDVEPLITHPFIASNAAELVQKLRKTIVDQRIYNVPSSMLSVLPLGRSIFIEANGVMELLAYIDAVVAQLPSLIGSDDVLQIEYIVQIRKALQQLANIIDKCNIAEQLTPTLTRSLIRRHLQGVRIPFEGEPLEGLQVMGILETRNIDFKNVIIMSMSDGNFPGTRIVDSSTIPYSLRYAYGLPTQEHHQGVYAYYFYRLISRAENVWMTYCSTADDKGTGEPSRYIRQLEYESGLPIQKIKVGVEVNLLQNGEMVVEKDEHTMELLDRYTSGEKLLSPTAFSSYVKCPMSFFYRYLAGVKVDDELEEGLDNKTFGKVCHTTAEYLYTDVKNEAYPMKVLKHNLDKNIEKYVDLAIAKECYNKDSFDSSMIRGELVIVRQIVIRYIKDNLVKYDEKHNDFVVDELEVSYKHPFEFEVNGQKRTIEFEGRADRIDKIKDGTMYRIIDYKTGKPHLKFGDFDKLFNGKSEERVSNTINTLIYSMIKYHSTGIDVQPALYYLRDMNNPEYSPLLSYSSKPIIAIEEYSAVAPLFEQGLREVLSKMFDPSVPFKQADDTNACTYCDFAPICGKKR